MTESTPARKPRRGGKAPAANLGSAATERAHELWSAACTTVALAGLSFWSVSMQLSAGIEVNQAVVTVGVVLLCVGRARGLGGATFAMLPGYGGGTGGVGR